MAVPNNSIAMILAAIGVLAAPARTLTRPIAAKVATSNPVSDANNVPADDPTKKIGVTMPPLPPKPKVIVVKRLFIGKAYQTVLIPLKDCSIVSSPRL